MRLGVGAELIRKLEAIPELTQDISVSDMTVMDLHCEVPRDAPVAPSNPLPFMVKVSPPLKWPELGVMDRTAGGGGGT